METEESKVIVFDGVCNFCNWAVNFIIKRDKGNFFMFNPSQSGAGQEAALSTPMSNQSGVPQSGMEQLARGN